MALYTNIECKGNGGISKIYLINPKDCKFDDNGFMTIKRKYGKYKRKIEVIDFD